MQMWDICILLKCDTFTFGRTEYKEEHKIICLLVSLVFHHMFIFKNLEKCLENYYTVSFGGFDNKFNWKYSTFVSEWTMSNTFMVW